MPATVDQLRRDLLALQVNERAELARFLIHTLDEPTEDGTPEEIARAWDAEVDRRAEEVLAGTADGQPAAEVFAELRSKYERKSSAA